MGRQARGIRQADADQGKGEGICLENNTGRVDQDGGEAREIWLGALIFSRLINQLGGGERVGAV
jgi:hypothetical protein